MKKTTLQPNKNYHFFLKNYLLLVLLLLPFLNFAQNTLVAELTGNPPDLNGWTETNISTEGEDIILTNASTTQAGAIFFSQPYDLNQCEKWRVEFDFRIFDGDGADGLSFWYLENPPTDFVNGASIGLPPNSRGIKVCFDTYDNHGGEFGNNPNPEIQVYYGEGYAENFPEPNMIKEFFGDLRNPDYQRAEISWDNGNIEIVIDGNVVLSGTPQAFDGVENIAEGYFGFSASTGAVSDRHSIKNVEVYIDAIELDSDYEQITLCDQGNDGFEQFDLTSVENLFSEIGTFTYYTSLSDAGSASNSIPESMLSNFTNLSAFQNQTIYIRIENESGCYVIGQLDLILTSPPVLDDVLVSIPATCDMNHDGIENYDLTQVVGQLVSNPQDYNVSYYETQAEANVGNISASIQTPSDYGVNAGSTKTIYVRISSMGDDECYTIGAIMLQTYRTPRVVSTQQLNVCNDNSNSYIFDLTENQPYILGNQNPDNSNITFYTSQQEADLGTGEISNANNYEITSTGCQTIYVRIENSTQTQCYETSSFQICVDDLVIGNPLNLEECAISNNDFGAFNLTSNDAVVLSGQDSSLYIIQYYLTMADAENAQNPILGPASYQAQNLQQTIYVRLENSQNSDCYLVESFTINTLENNFIELDAITSCGDNSASFDLTEAELQLNLTQDQQIVGYFENETDANNSNAPISDLSNYIANENSQEVYIRIEDTQNLCINLYRLPLIIESCDLFIPNGFSPNGDGVNDSFQVTGLLNKYPDFEMQIFSRYGRIVYKGNSSKDFWKGISEEGSQMPTGTYFYILNLKDSASEVIKGWVYLNR